MPSKPAFLSGGGQLRFRLTALGSHLNMNNFDDSHREAAERRERLRRHEAPIRPAEFGCSGAEVPGYASVIVQHELAWSPGEAEQAEQEEEHPEEPGRRIGAPHTKEIEFHHSFEPLRHHGPWSRERATINYSRPGP
jgi:hypothetical protein